MRIGFDVSKLGASDGLGTFTRELFAALHQEVGDRHQVISYDLLAEADPSRALAAIPAADAIDVLVATSFSAPRLAAGTRLFFVVYDLTFLSLPGCHTLANRLHCLSGLVAALAAGGRLLAISRQGAEELTALLGRDDDAIPVLPLAPAGDFRLLPPEALAARLALFGLAAGSYVLAVGSLEPRKNLATLLRAHALLPDELRRAQPLVAAGAPGWMNGELHAELEAARQQGFAKLLGRVDREALAALYGGATVFAYPSLAEGYGLPVVEAMACGAPVLTSNVSALPETAGGAARLADPLDPAALAAALAELLGSPAERARLRQLGLERAAELSWRDTARTLLDLLTRTLP